MPVLPGFTTTASAYDHYLDAADLRDDLRAALDEVDPDDVADLQERGERVRNVVASAEMPDDPAVKRSVRQLGEAAHDHDSRRPVGICGDAPSTVEGYVEFLLDAGIDSISVTPDVALETLLRVAELEGERDGATRWRGR